MKTHRKEETKQYWKRNEQLKKVDVIYVHPLIYCRFI